MALQLSWSIEGEKQLSRRLRGISSDVRNLRTPFTQAAKHLTKTYSNDVFRTRGGAIDERWKRLSPATVAAKARKGYPNPSQPLVATGEMKNAFNYRAEDDYAMIWNEAEYFKYHQSRRPREHVPRRVMMKIAEAQRKTIVRTFHKYFAARLRRRV